MALDSFSQQLSNKIVYIKSDSIAAIHYINAGRGRTTELAMLARVIRLKEVHLAIKSVAVHIPGEVNITPVPYLDSFSTRVPRQVPPSDLAETSL